MKSAKAYYQDNREELNEKRRERRSEHREELNEKQRDYHKRQSDEQREAKRAKMRKHIAKSTVMS